MSQGACTNFCKSNGAAYAITSDGSTCRCSNQAPLAPNKVDDSKCDKPCMGYPFEKCGGTSSPGLANVLLIGGSAGAPPLSTGSTSGSSNSSSSVGSGNEVVNGGKALNANNPGTLPPPGPTSSIVSHDHDAREKKRESSAGGGGDKKATTGSASAEDDIGSRSGSTSAGTVAASVMAVIAFGILFAVAVVFSKRRRQRLAQAVWSENMLLPSSLVHTSNDDELEGHDYTRSSLLYRNPSVHHHHHIPSPPTNAHFLPPPVLHPRQGVAMHMQQPSYPPPPLPVTVSRYNSLPRGGGGGGGPYQPSFLPPPLQLDSNHLNYKEPLSSPPPAFRGPHALQQNEEDGGDRSLSRPSVRSMGSVRQHYDHHSLQDRSVQRGSVDSSASGYAQE
ncbi:hypothetical protein BGZ83_011206 [Gryganskiella cystojenkinii]|nr:hypothetical protein BGZ83_011206 [Gryganskiella cystojenkinii]